MGRRRGVGVRGVHPHQRGERGLVRRVRDAPADTGTREHWRPAIAPAHVPALAPAHVLANATTAATATSHAAAPASASGDPMTP